MSPAWDWLLLRAGVAAAAVLFIGLYQPNWYVFHWLWSGDYKPQERIVERVAVFAVATLMLVGIFAGTDRQAAHDHPTGPLQCFSGGIPDKGGKATGELDKADALYFTVGNLTTAGTGSVVPISSSCRAMTAVQIAVGDLVILFGVGGLVALLIDRRTAARSKHDTSINR